VSEFHLAMVWAVAYPSFWFIWWKLVNCIVCNIVSNEKWWNDCEWWNCEGSV